MVTASTSSERDATRPVVPAAAQLSKWAQQLGRPQATAADPGRSAACSVRAGTVVDLLAQGPAPPCAACTLPVDPATTTPLKGVGLFFQRGWVTLCTTHKNSLGQESRSFAAAVAPPIPHPPPLPKVPRGQPPPVTSISARWRQQTSIKKQQQKKQQLKMLKTKMKRAGEAASVTTQQTLPWQ